MIKPEIKPQNPNFSSGPCSKHPGWSFDNLKEALIGRSHRSGPGKKKLQDVIETHREVLGIPQDYYIGIVPASDTGAMEMALWNLLGARAVDVLAWENFSLDWLKDVKEHLKLAKANFYQADYGDIPDLSAVNFNNDVVFAWNGTTSGVCVPGGDWIDANREGLTICDATSGIFAYDLPWDKLDVTTWSWQKVLGGEAAHGMIALSPRAVARLESYTPPWPLPKIFRIKKGNKINEGIFEGLTINTPSLIAVEDCLNALRWVKSVGGVNGTAQRSQESYRVIEEWVEKTPWVDFLTKDPAIRSHTSVTLVFTEDWFTALKSEDKKMDVINFLCKTLENENAGYDIKNYKTAPPGLRIWCGSTIESSDVKALLPWIEWGYEQAKNQYQKQAA